MWDFIINCYSADSEDNLHSDKHERKTPYILMFILYKFVQTQRGEYLYSFRQNFKLITLSSLRVEGNKITKFSNILSTYWLGVAADDFFSNSMDSAWNVEINLFQGYGRVKSYLLPKLTFSLRIGV